MVFSGIIFLFRFLPVFLAVYFLAPGRMKNFILFSGSLIFYAWGEPLYVFLMLFSAVSDYAHGIWIEKLKDGGRPGAAKLLLTSSILINLLLLGFFKYAGLIMGMWNALSGMHLAYRQAALPIGISFYTFQTMSYTIDVYRGGVKAQKNFIAFGAYVAMFPQLIAGPIVKYTQVEAQLQERRVTAAGFSQGAVRFILGLGKKVLIANRIGQLWEQIRAVPAGELAFLQAWLGILAFAFQIYFDFSGYSDMAVGLGRMLGFSFPENFNYPYTASSITQFWRRWHMSLSGWFREYVYIPLGGGRRGLKRQILNILAVWALTGIWHGAAWNFLLWGLWFAVFLILEKAVIAGGFFAFVPDKGRRLLGTLYTIIVVMFGWVLFCIGDMENAGAYLAALAGRNAPLYTESMLYQLGRCLPLLAAAAAGATPLPARTAVWLQGKLSARGARWIGSAVRSAYLAAVFLLSVAFIVDADYNPFLYFRF